MKSASAEAHSADHPPILRLLRAVINGESDFDAESLGAEGTVLALNLGLGAALAHVTRQSTTVQEEIHAADLMAQWTTADIFASTADVLRSAALIGCEPVLMKGVATSLRYYPKPHLRLMTDVDLLIPAGQLASLESRLRASGFTQQSHKPAAVYEDHHHSMPFFDSGRGVWIELHTRAHPPHSELAADSRFSLDGILTQVASVGVEGQTCRVMGDELQLVYTCTRWAEAFKAGRGVFPILDVALLLRTRSRNFDWNRVYTLVDGSWAATATHAMLAYVSRWRLADVPEQVLRRLQPRSGIGERVLRSLVDRLVTEFVMKDRQPGRILTPANLRLAWATLLRRRRWPWINVLALAPAIAFPPDRTDRFSVRVALDRARFAFRASRQEPSSNQHGRQKSASPESTDRLEP